MKFCVPSQDDLGLDARVHNHFGSAPFYVILDTASNLINTIPNPRHQHRHGHCNPMQQLGPHGLDAVVCHGLGRGAFLALQEAGIEVYTSDRTTVSELLQAAREGALRKLTLDKLCAGHGQGQGHGCP